MGQRIDPEAAEAHLCAVDPVMARVIAERGPFAMRADPEDPFLSLARAITYQQLSGKAAGTIFSRFLALVSDKVVGEIPRTGSSGPPLTAIGLSPARVLALTDDDFRSAGMSRQKVAALRDLADHFHRGELSMHLFDEWDDEEIIAHLTQVRGVGRWTAEMYLIFHLNRPDVLPVNDIGLNRAMMKLYGLAGMPKPTDVKRIGEPWRPWASVACWYLWRSEDVRPPE